MVRRRVTFPGAWHPWISSILQQNWGTFPISYSQDLPEFGTQEGKASQKQPWAVRPSQVFWIWTSLKGWYSCLRQSKAPSRAIAPASSCPRAPSESTPRGSSEQGQRDDAAWDRIVPVVSNGQGCSTESTLEAISPRSPGKNEFLSL